MKDDQPISLVLTCLECQNVMRRAFSIAHLDPCPEELDPEWDGVFLPELVTCDRCNAVDKYRVDPKSVAILRARESQGSNCVSVQRICVLEGNWIRRPSEGLALIRRTLEERPTDVVLWRRLGNLCNMLKDTGAAEQAWLRALEIDKEEFASALGLAHLSESLGDGARFTPRLVEALSRIRGLAASVSLTGDSAEELAASLLDLLETYVGQFPEAVLQVVWAPPEAPGTISKQDIVTLSDIHLSRLQRWDRLCEFLAAGVAISARLHGETPEELSSLQCFLDSDHELSRLFQPIRIKRPQRWVSSSKKRKAVGQKH